MSIKKVVVLLFTRTCTKREELKREKEGKGEEEDKRKRDALRFHAFSTRWSPVELFCGRLIKSYEYVES
ncbi:hypothetical protein KIN20_004496 [Parelaphostrongylus tenuis]|uniref:Uncharacterized protein n=1 Tax=Parelaphostrongylus tenuis TaxID=148309 RepID=A0AAD5M0R6_PARTN|nr:hypothetical protein KIN20_004496 [Parelaphostrongylus tenuis]